jgi:two-component system sensor histidine kinase VicK
LIGSYSPEKKTEILHSSGNAIERGVSFMQNVRNRMDIYFDHRAPSIVIELEAYKTGYIDIRNRGGKIRALTEITSDNIHYCKEIMKIVNEFRHLDGLKGGIAVSETEYMATTVLEEAKPLTQVIYSNVKEIVEEGQFIFDILWSKGIQAKQRIKEIEEGTKREFIETIQDPTEIQKVTFSLLNSATEEILIIFSAANVFRGRQEYSEMLQLLKEASEHNVRVRILVDANDPINKMIYNNTAREQSNIQFLSKSTQTKITILIVDKTYSLTIEMKDSSATTFDEAIGLATYSNSESTVSSYISIFETLWIQSEIYQQKRL